MQRTIGPLLAGATASILVALAPSMALAHTDSDVVAVPASEPATVTLEPTHGCGESATVSVRTRVPVSDAQAEPVEGWTQTATPDAEGNVVMEWTDGRLPADEAGAFPVTFTTPDTVGELITLPFIQTCENGEELAWIDGDPAAEYPAPRVLVLTAGSDAAETIDDVPLDAPGRDLLTAITDVDNPDDTTTTAAAPTTAAASTTVAATEPPTIDAPATSDVPAPSTDPASATSAPGADPATTVEDDGDDDGGGAPAAVVIGISIVVVAVGALVVMLRRRATPR